MIKNTLTIILISLAFACSQSRSSETDSVESIVDKFQLQLQKDLEEDAIEGSISAAIIKEDKIIWSKAFGFSDREHKTLADTSTLYRTGSITKSFTAFLMMQLAEDGLIKLSDPIELYLPEIKKLIGYSDATKITFLQLSTHTSGLIREPELKGADAGPIEDWEDKIIQSIPKTSFENSPDQKFSYSNIGYGILGLTLSRAAKRPFMELVKEKIFIPLKMNNSYFKITADKTTRLAEGMNGGPGKKLDLETPKNEHSGRGYKVPNGGIYSTPNDLAKFVTANMGYTNLLKPASLEFMQTVKSSDNYGVGFFIDDNNQLTILDHGGAVAGYTAQLAFEKTSKYGVILMRNYNWGATDLFKRSRILLSDLKKLETRHNSKD